MKLKKIYRAVVEIIHEDRAPKWVAEPVHRIANYVVGLTVTATAGLAAVANFTNIVPAKYQAEFSGFLVTAGAVVTAVAKWTGEIARNKVFAPDTVEELLAITHTPLPAPLGADGAPK